jgi:hypothetical protein
MRNSPYRTLGEPLVDVPEEAPAFRHPRPCAVRRPPARKLERGPQLQGLRFLSTGDIEGPHEGGFDIGGPRPRGSEDLPAQALDLGLQVPLAQPFRVVERFEHDVKSRGRLADQQEPRATIVRSFV